MAQPAQHQGVGRQPQVGLGLAAAGGKEQQIDGVTIGIGGLDHRDEVHQHKGELERTPLGLHVFRLLAPHHSKALAGSGSHGSVGDGKGQPHLFVAKGFDAPFDAPGLLAGLLQEFGGGGLLLLAGRVCRRALLLNPVRVGRDERAQGRLHGVSPIAGQAIQLRHRQHQAGCFQLRHPRQYFFDGGLGQPGGADLVAVAVGIDPGGHGDVVPHGEFVVAPVVEVVDAMVPIVGVDR